MNAKKDRKGSMAPRNKDLRKIWGGAKNLGMDEETLRDLVEDLFGSRSIGGLNATSNRAASRSCAGSPS